VSARRTSIAGMAQPAAATTDAAASADEALRWIDLLAGGIGPRRPTSRAERIAAEAVRAELSSAGVPAALQPFRGYSTFGLPYGLILAAAMIPAVLPARARTARSGLALAAAAALTSEGSLRTIPLSRALSRRPSHNVVATIEPRGEVRRTLCLVSHLDSSRSGLMFHPALQPFLRPWLTLQAASVAAGAAEPLLGASRLGRSLLSAARVVALTGLALLIERELAGEDVPGANDNAAGVAIAAQLLVEHADRRLEGTRLVFLATGCEEAGLLGMHAFLRSHDTSGWLFLNFDSLGGPATIRYLTTEGVFTRWPADRGLLAVAEGIAARRPELGLGPAKRPAGLTYDSTPILARGGRALTLSAQDGSIPNLHWPTDTVENVDRETISRALAVGRELIAAIDAGEADAPPGAAKRAVARAAKAESSSAESPRSG
jgi:hypothetical protein